ncbi:hypothetical protein BBP40_000838 [Aspergillus hancockii]|nr:hypothetical protein BBP40_000838 [Aspergillus hancockii]
MNSKFAVVELLLRKRQSIETLCRSDFAPLHYACTAEVDITEIAKLLLISGADIEVQAKDQQRPIHITAARGTMVLLNLLCDKGASLDSSRFWRPSALCGMSRGASVLKKDEVGWRPYQYAAYYGHPNVLWHLLSCSPTGWAREEANVGIDFSPSAGISEECKREIQELLKEVQRQPEVRIGSVFPVLPPLVSDMTARMVPGRLQTRFSRPGASQYESATIQAPAIPELLGTLEQGLHPNQSATPEQMRGDMRPHGGSSTLPQATHEQSSPVE